LQAEKENLKGMFRSLPLILFLVAGCGYFQPKEEVKENPIARVNETYLYANDIEGLIPEDLSDEDSVVLADRFVDEWVKKQLMIDRAQKEVDINEAEIQSKVLDYRYALTRSAYEKAYIQNNLNKEIKEREIKEYYDQHAADFVLKQNIVRCLFAQISKEAPRISRFTKDFKAYPESDIEDIREYCTQFANKAFLDDSVWVDFTEVISATPFEDIISESKILSSRDYLENQDSTYLYFLKILEYKMVDEVSPLEFVQEDIRNIIINKRKIALKRELEEKVYNDAEENDAFEVFDR